MQKRLSRRFFPWIFFHFMEFFWWYLAALLSLYALHRLQVILPVEVKEIAESVKANGQVKAPIGLFIAIAVGILFFRTLSRLLFFYPARVQQKNLRVEIIERLESSPVARYKNYSPGQIFQSTFNDLNYLRALIGFALLQVGNVIIAGIVIIPEINKFQSGIWPAFLPLFLAVLIFCTITFFFQKYVKEAMDIQAEVQNFIIESYDAKATIKNYHEEKTFIAKFLEVSKKELKVFVKSSVGYALSIPLIKLGFGFSLLVGAYLLKQKGLGASELILFAGYLFLFIEPLMFLSWMVIVGAQGYASWKRTKTLITSLENEESDEKTWKSSLVSNEPIILNLGFWDKTIQLNLKKGLNAVCGETGCGKSTLFIKMANALKANGMSLVMVQQEPYLFNDNIFNNIFLGKKVSEELKDKAKELIALLGLDILASSLDEVLKLEVGENGKRLSGGQAKRVVLIRSLLSEADVIIWDDPFSSIDILLERQILLSLKNNELTKNKTIILSSHRLTTVKLCDYAILLTKSEGVSTQGQTALELTKQSWKDFFYEQMV